MKKIMIVLLVVLALIVSGCSLKEKCEGCGGTLTYSIYKTRENYSNNVFVRVSQDKTRVTGYPDIRDSCGPKLMNDGYYAGGWGENTAFVNITCEEYKQLDKTPGPTELYSKIIDFDPFLEIYECPIKTSGPSQRDRDYWNEHIKNGTLGEVCKRVK
ncbi:MAG: hypothetical protein V1659_04540 [Candidatus Woesearchaeota archaeon]